MMELIGIGLFLVGLFWFWYKLATVEYPRRSIGFGENITRQTNNEPTTLVRCGCSDGLMRLENIGQDGHCPKCGYADDMEEFIRC